MADEQDQVALWYWQGGHADYELYGSEADAADAAVSMEAAETGAPAGVQFADGRIIELEAWPEYPQADRRRSRRMSRWATGRRELPPQRTVTAPFGGGEIEIDADAPSWLGVQ